MSVPPKSQRPNEPSAPQQVVPAENRVGTESTEAFLQELFGNGAHFEESFRNLCDSGCPHDEFGGLLRSVCMLMSWQTIPLVNGGKLTKGQLKGLPKRLRDLGEIIGALNLTPLAPGNEAKFMPEAPPGTSARIARDYLVQRYEMLPGMLYVYAQHIERFTRIARSTIKRLTTSHLWAITILRYVDERTGSPRYGDMAELLEQGCLILGEEKSVPKFLTADGLAKLYQRWGTAVCGPKVDKIQR
jgi:hypothetical protein